MTTDRVLVVDVGTSSVRVGVYDASGSAQYSLERELLPDTPADGIVEFDALVMAETCLELAADALDHAGPVDGIGITNQRGSDGRLGPRDGRARRARHRLAGPPHDRCVPEPAVAGRAFEPEPVGHQGAVDPRPASRA